MYHITPRGRAYFSTLLREALSSHTAQLSDLDACLFFLDQLAPAETVALLRARYERLASERASITYHMRDANIQDRAHRLVADHQLALLDAELGWLARTLIEVQTEAVTATESPTTDPDVHTPASRQSPSRS